MKRRDASGWWTVVLLLALSSASLVFLGSCHGDPESPANDDTNIVLPTTLDEAALVRRPTSSAPARPQVALLLHGFGSAPEKFLDVADAIRYHGLVAIIVRGPQQLGTDRYTWTSEAATHALLRHVLHLAGQTMELDTERPLLVGYSVGATLAVRLVAQYPSAYRGAFAIAPGPLGSVRPSRGEARRPLAILVGDADGPSARAVDGIEQAWGDAGEPIRVLRYPGGHRVPADWRTLFDDAVPWLLSKASS